MAINEKNLRLILGLKIRQNRQGKHFSLKELSDRCGLSVSYLNEIEKGKKYPKADKIMAISQALEVPYDDLVSLKLDNELNPLSGFLKTSLLQDLPFDLFGIDASDLMSLISEDPTRFSALVATLVEIARNYDVQVEQVLQRCVRTRKCTIIIFRIWKKKPKDSGKNIN
jgi:transcriptional regulator with XRE-family HTH domain